MSVQSAMQLLKRFSNGSPSPAPSQRSYHSSSDPSAIPKDSVQRYGLFSQFTSRTFPQAKQKVDNLEISTSSNTGLTKHSETVQELCSSRIGAELKKEYNDMPPKRREAARMRVKRLKSFLRVGASDKNADKWETSNLSYSMITDVAAAQQPRKDIQSKNAATLILHRRRDSGTCNKYNTVSKPYASLPPLHEDILWLSLKLIASPDATLPTVHGPPTCAACFEVFSRSSLDPRARAAWRVHSCGQGSAHFLHIKCLECARLVWCRRQLSTLECRRCDSFVQQIQAIGVEEMAKRVERMEKLLLC